MHFRWPLPAAQWSGDEPNALLQLFASAFLSRSSRTHFACPATHAQWRGRKPSCGVQKDIALSAANPLGN